MKTERIIEFKPIQIRKIIENLLIQEGFVVRKIKSSKSGTIAYLADENIPAKSEFRSQKLSDIGCSTKICNCLKSIDNIETVGQFESYLMKKISPEDTTEAVILRINGMGKGSYEKLLSLFRKKKLIINANGEISKIS